jgi:amidohydrolase
MHNASIKLDITEAYPPVINDPQMSDFAMEVAKQVLGQENVIEADEPSMGGEDFAYYLQRKPGAFLWLGAGLEGDAAYNHNPKFSPDESAFIKGMAMHVNLVLEYLKK